MLEPNNLPEDLEELERELSQPPTSGIPAHVRSRVMDEIHSTLRHQNQRQRPGWRGRVLLGLAAIAAGLLLAFYIRREPPRPGLVKQGVGVAAVENANDADVANDVVLMPTIQAYRLTLSDPAEDWEVLLGRRASSFEDTRAFEDGTFEETGAGDDMAVVLTWSNWHRFADSYE